LRSVGSRRSTKKKRETRQFLVELKKGSSFILPQRDGGRGEKRKKKKRKKNVHILPKRKGERYRFAVSVIPQAVSGLKKKRNRKKCRQTKVLKERKEKRECAKFHDSPDVGERKKKKRTETSADARGKGHKTGTSGYRSRLGKKKGEKKKKHQSSTKS